MVISYNPGYQSVTRELKESTRQRFVSLAFNYPGEEAEAEIVVRESSGNQTVFESCFKVKR